MEFKKYLKEVFGEYDIEDKIKSFQNLEPSQRLRLIYQWTIERNINLKQFIELIKYSQD